MRNSMEKNIFGENEYLAPPFSSTCGPLSSAEISTVEAESMLLSTPNVFYNSISDSYIRSRNTMATMSQQTVHGSNFLSSSNEGILSRNDGVMKQDVGDHNRHSDFLSAKPFPNPVTEDYPGNKDATQSTHKTVSWVLDDDRPFMGPVRPTPPAKTSPRDRKEKNRAAQEGKKKEIVQEKWVTADYILAGRGLNGGGEGPSPAPAPAPPLIPAPALPPAPISATANTAPYTSLSISELHQLISYRRIFGHGSPWSATPSNSKEELMASLAAQDVLLALGQIGDRYLKYPVTTIPGGFRAPQTVVATAAAGGGGKRGGCGFKKSVSAVKKVVRKWMA